MGQALPPISWTSLVTEGDFRPVWTIVVVAALAAYTGAIGRLRDQGETFSPARQASFSVGAVLLLWTVSSGVEVYSSNVFWMHMVQHLLLIMVVPALLVVGHPLTVLARATPGDRVERVLHGRLVSVVTHPLVGFLVYAAVIVATHLTTFMDTMMTSTWLAPFEQVLYLAAGYVFLLPLLGNEPIRWHPPLLMRIFLLVVGMVPDTVVGIVLLQTETNLFPQMLPPGRPWAPDAVHDLNLGGGIMWALGDGLMMVFAVGLIVALVSTSRGESELVGSWLEGVRRSTMTSLVTRDGAEESRIGSATDVDADDDALAAYNAMLERLNRPEPD